MSGIFSYDWGGVGIYLQILVQVKVTSRKNIAGVVFALWRVLASSSCELIVLVCDINR